MGLMDYLDEDIFSSSDEYEFDTSDFFDDGDFSIKDDSGISWDWFGQDEDMFSEFQMDEPDWSFMDDEPSMFDKAGDLLGKVPSSIWDRLMEAGIGGLSEWLRQKSETPRRSGGGGGGAKPAVTAVTTSVPVGTRKKG